jgi:hypothetical protein
MRFSKADGGLPDLLNRILADARDRDMREQAVDVISREPLTGNRLSRRRNGRNGGIRIWYSGRIRTICPLAAFCQQRELGPCPVRRALQRRIQGFLYRRPGNDAGLLAPASHGANCHAQVLRE